jgi:hypothetical protein
VQGPWTKLSDINVTAPNGSGSVQYAQLLPNIEDPFLWVDKRSNFHIINHRYVNTETDKCYGSTIRCDPPPHFPDENGSYTKTGSGHTRIC